MPMLQMIVAGKCRIAIPHHGASPGASRGAGPLLSAPGLVPGPGAGLDFSGLARGLALKTFRSAVKRFRAGDVE